jgi:hypothetical protein
MPSRLRTTVRAYEAAIDDLTRQAGVGRVTATLSSKLTRDRQI